MTLLLGNFFHAMVVVTGTTPFFRAALPSKLQRVSKQQGWHLKENLIYYNVFLELLQGLFVNIQCDKKVDNRNPYRIMLYSHR